MHDGSFDMRLTRTLKDVRPDLRPPDGAATLLGRARRSEGGKACPLHARGGPGATDQLLY